MTDDFKKARDEAFKYEKLRPCTAWEKSIWIKSADWAHEWLYQRYKEALNRRDKDYAAEIAENNGYWIEKVEALTKEAEALASALDCLNIADEVIEKGGQALWLDEYEIRGAVEALKRWRKFRGEK